MNEEQAELYAAVVADGHLDGESESFSQFLVFLQNLPCTPVQALYILGDLFTLWLGAPRLQFSYHAHVIEALLELSHTGVRVIYVEGNRDYFLAPYYLNQPFTEIASEYSALTVHGRRFYFAHGDLVNAHDRQYRLWRRFSRNRAVYSLFNSLPGLVAIRLAHYLEKTFRNTNRKHKTSFPAATCEHFAQGLFGQQYDVVIVGHFHYQYQRTIITNGRSKSLYVLPAWKDTPVYLEISLQGQCAFKRFHAE